MAKAGLMTFLRGSTDPKDKMPGCANYDHGKQECLLETGQGKSDCLVQVGKRCAYFERAVLPTAADIGQIQDLTFAYERATKHIVVRTESTKEERFCPDCKTGVLQPRERLCGKCKRLHSRASSRKSRTRSPNRQS
jgi:hypothetical protein